MSLGNVTTLACGWLRKTVYFLPSRQRILLVFLLIFLLFPFTKLPILLRNKYVILLPKRKRPPQVRGQHWSPASIFGYKTNSSSNVDLFYRRIWIFGNVLERTTHLKDEFIRLKDCTGYFGHSGNKKNVLDSKAFFFSMSERLRANLLQKLFVEPFSFIRSHDSLVR